MQIKKITQQEREKINERLSMVRLFIKHPDQIVYRFGKESLLDPANEPVQYFAKKYSLTSINDIMYCSDEILKKQYKHTKKAVIKVKEFFRKRLSLIKFNPVHLLDIDSNQIDTINQYYGKSSIDILPIKGNSAKKLRENLILKVSDIFFVTNRQLTILLGGKQSSKITGYLRNIYFG